MNSKKRRHKGFKIPPPPTTGRAAFRGILHPLILAGQTIAPASIARASTTTPSNVDPYSQATVTIPDTEPGQRDYCQLSDIEQAWCDINPTFSWCYKTQLFSNDSKCVPNTIKCPPSQAWIDVFHSTDLNTQFGWLQDYLLESGIENGVNGKCIDEALAEKKKKEEEDYDNWVKTRGCRYDNFPLEVGVQNSFIKTPCPFGTGDDNKPGQIKQYGGKQYKFI